MIYKKNLKNLILSILALSFLAIGAELNASTASANRLPRGSFSAKPALSVKELVDQINKNPTLRNRYAGHFGVKPEELGTRIEKTLKLIALQKPVKVRVWYVDKQGKINSKMKLLPKGSMVFATSDGQPVILWRCGNPMTTKLPEIPPEVKVKPSPPEVIMSQAIAIPPGMVETLPTYAIAPAVTVTDAVPLPLPPSINNRVIPWWILGLSFAGNGDKPAPKVIPEFPAASLAAIGLPALAFFKRRKAAK